MINFLIDNIFIEFGGRIFQQNVRIFMGTNCAPLLADLFYTHTKPSLSKNVFVKEKRSKKYIDTKQSNKRNNQNSKNKISIFL